MAPEEAEGDPDGVNRSREELFRSVTNLNRDERQVIGPLRREAYQNNIQALVEGLLQQRGRERRDPGTSAQ